MNADAGVAPGCSMLSTEPLSEVAAAQRNSAPNIQALETGARLSKARLVNASGPGGQLL